MFVVYIYKHNVWLAFKNRMHPNIYLFVTDKPDGIDSENTPREFQSVDPPNKSRNNVSMRWVQHLVIYRPFSFNNQRIQLIKKKI